MPNTRRSADDADDAAVLAIRAELAAEGCQIPIVSPRRPHDVAPMHTHPFTARVAVLAGELTVRTAGGEASTYAAGDRFQMPRDTPHEEIAGPKGALLLIGQMFD